MKLKTKLTAAILGVSAAAFALCGTVSALSFKNYSLDTAAAGEREKLAIAGRAFQQVGTREDFEDMGEIARDAYLKYQFRRCYEDGYALIKDGEPLVNLTGYEIVDLSPLTGEYAVQEVGGRRILLLLEPLPYPDGFSVLAASDVSSVWENAGRQAAWSGLMFLASSLGVSLLLTLFLTGALRPLEELKNAAAAISRGELGAKVAVRSSDELGQVGQAFNRMSDQVEQQVEDLQLLLGALAHEMKTPMTSVMGYADSLLHVRLPKEAQTAALKRIYESGARMEQLSSRLLSLLGLYENDSISFQAVPADALFQQVRQDCAPFLEERGVRLLLDCPQPVSFQGDAVLLESLLTNLVQNACRASHPGDPIRLSARPGTLIVADCGCGIPEKDLPHVTKAFYMADRSRSRSQGGSGLGLALCERIAALHGASLTIESREGQGTTVTVAFTKPLQNDEYFGRQP